MFFKKKGEEGLPDLPLLKPHFDKDEDVMQERGMGDNHALPSFPASPTYNKFTQVAIKDAVNDEKSEVIEKGNSREMEEWQPSSNVEEVELREHDFDELKEIKPHFRRGDTESGTSDSDVFVKIEKFRTARKALYDVNAKLHEIDELIKRIRETKLREEQEFSFWERELANIKARVHEVTETIFEKAD